MDPKTTSKVVGLLLQNQAIAELGNMEAPVYTISPHDIATMEVLSKLQRHGFVEPPAPNM